MVAKGAFGARVALVGKVVPHSLAAERLVCLATQAPEVALVVLAAAAMTAQTAISVTTLMHPRPWAGMVAHGGSEVARRKLHRTLVEADLEEKMEKMDSRALQVRLA